MPKKKNGNKLPDQNQQHQAAENKSQSKKTEYKLVFYKRAVRNAMQVQNSPNEGLDSIMIPEDRLIHVGESGGVAQGRLVRELRNRQMNYHVYHVWLDCLFKSNPTFEDVKAELAVLFGNDHKKCLQHEHVFVLGHKEVQGKTLTPAGSCFMLIHKSMKHINVFELKSKAFKTRTHLLNVDLETLVDSIYNNNILVFAKAYANHLPPTVLGTFPQAESKLASGKTSRSSQESLKPKIKVDPPQKHRVVSPLLQAAPIAAQIASTSKVKPNGKVSLQNIHGAENVGLFEQMLREAVENDIEKSDYVTEILPNIRKFGNAVIKIDNLPAKLNIHALNLTLGTYKIKKDQVVAVTTPSPRGQEMMSVMIVLPSDKSEIKNILSKNKCKNMYNVPINILKTDLKQLEAFLRKNHDKIRFLAADDVKPIHHVGYANHTPFVSGMPIVQINKFVDMLPGNFVNI